MKARIDKILNRLRARLYNMIEQLNLDEKQAKALKQAIKDITSVTWNDLAELADDVINTKEQNND